VFNKSIKSIFIYIYKIIYLKLTKIFFSKIRSFRRELFINSMKFLTVVFLSGKSAYEYICKTLINIIYFLILKLRKFATISGG
jgi:hypothetical protein